MVRRRGQGPRGMAVGGIELSQPFFGFGQRRQRFHVVWFPLEQRAAAAALASPKIFRLLSAIAERDRGYGVGRFEAIRLLQRVDRRRQVAGLHQRHAQQIVMLGHPSGKAG